MSVRKEASRRRKFDVRGFDDGNDRRAGFQAELVQHSGFDDGREDPRRCGDIDLRMLRASDNSDNSAGELVANAGRWNIHDSQTYRVGVKGWTIPRGAASGESGFPAAQAN